MSTVLAINGLSKRYRSIQAVDDLRLTVQQGNVYGILGPNGSGKTTTLAMILGVVQPDAGSFSWFGGGGDADARKRIGTLLETPSFYPYLNATQNLRIVATIKGVEMDNFDDILRQVNLYERRNSAFRTYSLGMKQRLAIAATLVGSPEALVLDEPTNGLDAEGIAEVRELILKLAAKGQTIILASHILDEVQKVCSHVAVLKSGKLLADGTIDSVLQHSDQVTIEIAADDIDQLEKSLKSYPGILEVNRSRLGLCTVAAEQHVKTADLNKFLVENGVAPSHLLRITGQLETQFLEIVKKGS